MEINSQQVLQELRRLRNQIEHHDERYFALGAPKISDEEYDRLFQRLSGLERQHPDLVTPDSPTQRVGTPPQSGFERVNHRSPMPGLETVFGEQGLRQFDGRIRGLLGEPSALTYVVEPKMEGAAVELVYEKGTLCVASNRGDGHVGEDVTLNVKSILNVPLNLAGPKGAPPLPAVVAVWADVYMETEAFEALNRQRAARGRPPFPDPRSAAVRCLTNRDSRITARCPLDVFCHGAGRLEGSQFRTQYELMVGLQQWGLRVNRPQMQVCGTLDEMIAACRCIEHHRRRFPFVVSGAVIKVNELSLQHRLGELPRNLQWAVACKFGPNPI
jgi:DNA ligase (NAD+)